MGRVVVEAFCLLLSPTFSFWIKFSLKTRTSQVSHTHFIKFPKSNYSHPYAQFGSVLLFFLHRFGEKVLVGKVETNQVSSLWIEQYFLSHTCFSACVQWAGRSMSLQAGKEAKGTTRLCLQRYCNWAWESGERGFYLHCVSLAPAGLSRVEDDCSGREILGRFMLGFCKK